MIALLPMRVFRNPCTATSVAEIAQACRELLDQFAEAESADQGRHFNADVLLFPFVMNGVARGCQLAEVQDSVPMEGFDLTQPNLFAASERPIAKTNAQTFKHHQSYNARFLQFQTVKKFMYIGA